MVYQKVVKRR